MSVSVSCCMHVFVVKFLFMVTSLQPLQPPLYIPLLLRVVSSWMWLLFYFIVFYTPTTFPHRAMRHNVRFIMICVCMRLKAYYVFSKYYLHMRAATLHIEISVSAVQHLVKLATSAKEGTHIHVRCAFYELIPPTRLPCVEHICCDVTIHEVKYFGTTQN